MSTTEFSASEGRNRKGEWRPSYPIAYAPVFIWPPRPLALLKWLVSWPGFMWPANLAMLTIAAIAWRWTEPSLASCLHFEWRWLARIYLRNEAIIWLIYGGFYLYLYMWKAEGTKTKYDVRWPAKRSKLFLFQDQVKDNIFWTAGVGGLVWTLYEAATLWMMANHHIPYFAFAAHPVWSGVWILAIPFWREFHFYWVHRLIHWKPLYRHVHYLHHKNVNPNPWSGMAMHPIEIVLYFSVVLIHWVIPGPPFAFFYDLQHAGIAPASVHHGFEGPLADGKWPTGSYFHYLHHRYFECNYGAPVLPFDRWFHTFRDGRPDGVGAELKEEQVIARRPVP